MIAKVILTVCSSSRTPYLPKKKYKDGTTTDLQIILYFIRYLSDIQPFYGINFGFRNKVLGKTSMTTPQTRASIINLFGSFSKKNYEIRVSCEGFPFVFVIPVCF